MHSGYIIGNDVGENSFYQGNSETSCSALLKKCGTIVMHIIYTFTTIFFTPFLRVQNHCLTVHTLIFVLHRARIAFENHNA